MSWIDELKRQDLDALEQSRVDAELKVRDERMFRAAAPDYWSGLVAQLKADCAELGRCRTTIESDVSVTLEGTEGSPIRTLAIQFMLDGHAIRIAHSHSNDGMSIHSDGVEKIRLELQSDDSIAFVTGIETYRIVTEVSRYLIMRAIQGRRPY